MSVPALVDDSRMSTDNFLDIKPNCSF